jgi:hypothetical protein
MNVYSILGIFVVLAVIGLIVYFVAFRGQARGDRVTIVNGSQPGDTPVTRSIVLPASFNQPQGAVYSYTGWILVKDFTVGYGERRNILSKGDAPGIYLDSTSNSLVFAVKTYGTTETILVPGISAMKWIHFAMVVDQSSVDIYINGTLRQHHTLGQLPDQTDDPIVMGPGWSGVLARVNYFPRAVSVQEIRKDASAPLPDSMERTVSGPNYFDMSWYIGRLNSI